LGEWNAHAGTSLAHQVYTYQSLSYDEIVSNTFEHEG
jgi:hypothetical protein